MLPTPLRACNALLKWDAGDFAVSYTDVMATN